MSGGVWFAGQYIHSCPKGPNDPVQMIGAEHCLYCGANLELGRANALLTEAETLIRSNLNTAQSRAWLEKLGRRG